MVFALAIDTQCILFNTGGILPTFTLQVVGSAVGDDEPLMSAGLDSLGSVEFANVLSQKLGMQASAGPEGSWSG